MFYHKATVFIYSQEAIVATTKFFLQRWKNELNSVFLVTGGTYEHSGIDTPGQSIDATGRTIIAIDGENLTHATFFEPVVRF